MSSEMRELMQSVLDFVNRQPCRCMSIAQLGERDYCDRCQSVKNLRALLARTEAGADDDSLFTPAEHLAACRKDWKAVCDALGANGQHMDPADVVRAIEKLKAAETV